MQTTRMLWVAGLGGLIALAAPARQTQAQEGPNLKAAAAAETSAFGEAPMAARLAAHGYEIGSALALVTAARILIDSPTESLEREKTSEWSGRG